MTPCAMVAAVASEMHTVRACTAATSGLITRFRWHFLMVELPIDEAGAFRYELSARPCAGA